MNEQLMQQLVDLYIDEELTEEAMESVEASAMTDPAIGHDIYTLRATLNALRKSDDVHLSEESSQRVLMKLRTKGVGIEQNSPDPAHLQYHLPIQG